MANVKRETLKSKRESPLYNKAFTPCGNGKLLDYDNPETGEKIRYAQINTRPIKDCPFRSKGCEAVCYACKGNHMFPSVQKSREESYEGTRRADYEESMTYTIRTEKGTKRYFDATMYIRTHEAGDFYSFQYLRKSLHTWKQFTPNDHIEFKFYTKSFPFFLMLTKEEKDILRRLMKDGIVTIMLSVDDTTSPEQWKAYHKMREEFPLCNTYYCTEFPEKVPHDHICDCANCAKCGKCNKATGIVIVVKIHSASKADMEVYRACAK